MKKRGLGILSGVQIFLLIVSMISFSWILGQPSFVSAQSATQSPTRTGGTNSVGYSKIHTYSVDGETQTLTQKVIGGELKYYGNDGEIIGDGVVKGIATKNNLDLSGGYNYVVQSSLTKSNLQLSSLKVGQDLGNGLTIKEIGNIDGKYAGTVSVPGGQEIPIEGSGSTRLGSATAKSLGLTKERGIPALGITTTNFLGGHLLEGLTWSLFVVGAIQLIAPLLGADSDMTNALSVAATAGIMSGKLAYGLFGAGTSTADAGLLGSWLSPTYATGIGIAVAVVVFVALYKKDSKKVIEFQCNPYEPPLGGADCNKCGSDGLPCSEYRCRSLGQACELLNSGSKEEKCVWVSKDDVRAPTMTPSTSALTERHKYTNHETRPPSLGTKIVRDDSTNGCIKPFTPLTFGVVTNEPAQCKIDIGNMKKFDEMKFFLGETNLFLENHTQEMRLPSPDAIAEFGGEELIIGADGIYDFYVKCQDKNGNVNEEDFVFSFCVDPTPDTTPPIIEDTSIRDGSPVAFNSEKIDLSLFVNEPAECKWSVQDKAFLDMENNMSCSTEVYQQNANQLYSCSTQLTGIKDREENSFYFRCKDQPNKPDNERNVNTQSKKFTLLGSQELNIIRFSPEANKTLFDSTESVRLTLEVETSNGANEGQSICYISPSGNPDSYIAMSDTNSFKHSQLLVLPAGTYNYYFRCIDAGGNSDEAITNFQIETDNKAPFITRLYKEGVDALKIITNEKAECSYSINTCNFEVADGIDMRTLDVEKKVIHFAEWKTGQTYHIKCADEFGNQPAPDACTIQISASTFE
ncbi:hypothetical protein COU60_00345 [Candidatus Pacearchaeota archaeon CG10_big_fil_rev_8_21_14_0_10_34_76]|nr:MAG: hypothetical protein COU60_00345 [Candidatus Pacearchaeota archaeon CG10_big_fil_rev_8_21_14_0_10_34_76]